jgi:nicotinate-nucleotide adenylyltransferase
MEQRIGIFSGTFDPVHSGHIAFAKEALNICKLDKVVFLPERNPRDKCNVTDLSHRIELLRMAIKGVKAFEAISPLSAQFTVKKTLPELHAMFKNTSLTLLLGSDVVKTSLVRWEELDVLLGDVSLAIGMRANDKPDEISVTLQELEKNYGVKTNYTLINTPNMDMASSYVRNGTIDASKLQPSVVNYIKRHKLYI